MNQRHIAPGGLVNQDSFRHHVEPSVSIGFIARKSLKNIRSAEIDYSQINNDLPFKKSSGEYSRKTISNTTEFDSSRRVLH